MGTLWLIQLVEVDLGEWDASNPMGTFQLTIQTNCIISCIDISICSNWEFSISLQSRTQAQKKINCYGGQTVGYAINKTVSVE